MKLSCTGEMQEDGRAGRPLEPFQIFVKDDEGAALAGVPVEFIIAEGSGHFTYKDPCTDPHGGAIAEFVATEGGRYRIECLVGDDKRNKMPFKGVVAPDRRKRASRSRAKANPATASKPVAEPPPAVPAAPEPKPPATEVKSPPPAATVPTTQPVRRPAKPSPPRRPVVSPPPLPAGIRRLLTAVIGIMTLVVVLTIVLIAQHMTREKSLAVTDVDRARSALKVGDETAVFQNRSATTR